MVKVSVIVHEKDKCNTGAKDDVYTAQHLGPKYFGESYLMKQTLKDGNGKMYKLHTFTEDLGNNTNEGFPTLLNLFIY